MKRLATTTWSARCPTQQNAVKSRSGGQPWTILESTCTKTQAKSASGPKPGSSSSSGCEPTARASRSGSGNETGPASSTESEWVAQCLEELGHEVIVADPNFAPMYAQRSRKVKTDRRDARALCEACALGAYRPAHRSSEASRSLRAQVAGPRSARANADPAAKPDRRSGVCLLNRTSAFRGQDHPVQHREITLLLGGRSQPFCVTVCSRSRHPIFWRGSRMVRVHAARGTGHLQPHCDPSPLGVFARWPSTNTLCQNTYPTTRPGCRKVAGAPAILSRRTETGRGQVTNACSFCVDTVSHAFDMQHPHGRHAVRLSTRLPPEQRRSPP